MADSLVTVVESEIVFDCGLPIICGRCALEMLVLFPGLIKFTLPPDSRPMAPGYGPR